MTGLASTFAIVFPLIRRRRALVDVREAASNVVSGHVADSIANAEAVRAVCQGAGRGAHSRNVRDLGTKTPRSCDYQALRIDTITAPLHVLTNALGLITSSLDSESESLIQDALWTLMAGRTAIVIAHRLSTVRRMDRLVVLDRGGIVEQGPHLALLERGGIYASLWAHQSGGFLGGDPQHVVGPTMSL